MLLRTKVPFPRNAATPIFSHPLVLTYEKNHPEFIEIFPGKALEVKLLYPFLHVFLAIIAASRKLFQLKKVNAVSTVFFE